jgi:hypothetical protein
MLASVKVLNTELDYNPFEEENYESSFKLNKKYKRDDESDDEERENKGSRWKI